MTANTILSKIFSDNAKCCIMYFVQKGGLAVTMINADSKNPQDDTLDVYTGQMLTKKNYIYAEYQRDILRKEAQEHKEKLALFSFFFVIIVGTSLANLLFPV